MNARFIVLHFKDGAPLYINVSQIQAFWPVPKEETQTYIQLIGDEDATRVKESTIEIVQLIGLDYFNGSKSV